MFRFRKSAGRVCVLLFAAALATGGCLKFQPSPYDSTRPAGLLLLAILLGNPFQAYALGQPDVNTVTDLRDGLNSPQQIALAGGKLFVVDGSNNRVLIWNTPPEATRTPPDVVLGQPDHAQTGVNTRGRSASSLSGPQGVASDGTRLAVADSNNFRVLIWNSIPAADFAPADVVLGQSDFTSNVSGTSATSMLSPRDLVFCAGRLYVADTQNNRVLIWNAGAGASTGQAADGALGQVNHTASAGAAGATGLNRPHGLACDGTRLFAADFNNNRVLIWNTAPAGFAAPADVAVGQANLTANGPSLTATGLNGARAVATAGGALYISDEGAHRVLKYNTIPAGSGAAADLVLGQGDFMSGGANAGGAAAGFSGPLGVAGDGARLYVADTGNHRIGIWPTGPSTNGQAMNAVLGQTAVTSLGGANAFSAGAHGLKQITGVGGAGDLIFAADAGAHRVLIWNTVPSTGLTGASLVLGQNDFTTVAANGPGTANGLNGPSTAFYDGARFFVSDTANHRVLAWDGVPATSGAGANLVLGQADFTSNAAATMANRMSSPFAVVSAGGRLFAADTGNHRVLTWSSSPAANQTPADGVLGQANFTAALGGAGAGGVSGPAGLFSDGTRLFLVDSANHRVLVWNSLPAGLQTPADLVLGQTDFASAAANAGGASPSAHTLKEPTHVFVFDGRLFVADTGNHRVLVWNSLPAANFQAADQVVGQPDFASALANNSGLNASGLNRPVGVYVRENRLFIADRENRRILVLEVPMP